MAIAIVDSTNFAPSIRERSINTTASHGGRRGPLASMIAMACGLGSSDGEVVDVAPHELTRRRDQATIDRWMLSLQAQ